MFVERVEEISYREPVIWPHGAIQRMIVVGPNQFRAQPSFHGSKTEFEPEIPSIRG
jgi:hypothetical protein